MAPALGAEQLEPRDDRRQVSLLLAGSVECGYARRRS